MKRENDGGKMDKKQYREEGEIDFRTYLDIIVKRRKIVLAAFIVFTLIGIVSGIRVPKAYMASSSIMIIPPKVQISFFQQSPVEKNSLAASPVVQATSLPTHEVLLKSDMVMERVTQTLGLTDKPKTGLQAENISGMLNIQQVKDTDILRLEAVHADPKVAMTMANTWAQEYMKYNNELISGEVKGTGDFIIDQFEIAKRNLAEAEERLRDFNDKYKLDLMKTELRVKKDKLNDYRLEMIELESALKRKTTYLTELKKEIEKQEKFVVVSKAITDDALWRQVSDTKNTSNLDKKKLRSEEVNPIYENLALRIVNTEIELNTMKPHAEDLKQWISFTEKEIADIDKTVRQKELEAVQLDRQIAIYKRTYDNLSAKTEDARIAKTAQLGEVKIISFAKLPKYPVVTKKRQTAAMSAILGLVIGIFAAFAMEFWEKSKRA